MCLLTDDEVAVRLYQQRKGWKETQLVLAAVVAIVPEKTFTCWLGWLVRLQNRRPSEGLMLVRGWRCIEPAPHNDDVFLKYIGLPLLLPDGHTCWVCEDWELTSAIHSLRNVLVLPNHLHIRHVHHVTNSELFMWHCFALSVESVWARCKKKENWVKPNPLLAALNRWLCF